MKLEIGDLVYISNEMPPWMSHFQKGKFAIITTVGNSYDYMTNIGGWYDINQLRLIKKNPNNNLLKKLESVNI